MSELANNIAYIKGLADGMKIAEKSDEGKLITKIIDALEDAVGEIDSLWDRNAELESSIVDLESDTEAIGADIDVIFDALDDADDENYDDDDDYMYDDDDDLFDSYDDDDELFEILCPECNEDIMVDFDMINEDGDLICPNCNHRIELEFDVDDEDDE